ncbi:Coatomer, alpha subunit [Histomonas meleagridis]|uniref:Coatomer, alpha subunit n=1 Tax=Histomonas meleagridis TaxID=135588 RepID=UPI003559F16A|nr:Coatomer, alpha subunit [Histomonas meleagridis]KAH0803285.1 Coatomer, alpha subunit [Histomonas meleagridis]
MQVKLELETDRVKGISFHPVRPYILFSTYVGKVYLYDYSIGAELANFSVTKGGYPVRCVAFHPTQPIFACGTDTGEIIIYNWQKRSKLFSLNGHTDFVRSVEFHSVHPLLVSSSDDSTVRIWNWQNRKCISIIDEHTYVVMSASFNPVKPLVATACLDDLVRVFDISSLLDSSMSQDADSALFPTDSNATLTCELEEHPDGADTVAWDPNGNKLISGGEDCTVKLFTFYGNEAKFTRVITTHNGPVTCVCFHKSTSTIVTTSDDGTLRLFDGNSYQQIARYDTPGSRIWYCTCHPKNALVALGHDHGLIILKFAKERLPYDVQGNSILWVQDKKLHLTDVVSKENEEPISIQSQATSVSWNTARGLALVSSSKEHEIVDMKMKSPIIKGEGTSSVWLSRSSIASLSETKDKLIINEYGGVSSRQIPIPITSRIFTASAQRVYLSTHESLILFDVVRSKTITEIPFPDSKSISFDDKRERICVRNSNCILTSKVDLTDYNIFHNSDKIKSCCWCGKEVLFTTRNHLKYIIKSESGIICSLPSVLYIIKACNETAWFVNSDGALFKREIEMGELKLKSSLMNNHSDIDAKRIIAKKPPIGFAIMEFAANHGRYDIAASLAQDPKSKFEMSLEAQDFETASKAADELNDPEIYKKLAKEALNNGRFELAETSMKKGNDFDSLAFLYLITGESEKLQKLSKQTNSLLYSLWSNDDEAIHKIINSSLPNIEIIDSPTLKIEYGKSILKDWPTVGVSNTNNIISTTDIIDEDDENEGWNSDNDDLLEGINQNEENNDNDEVEEGEGWDVDIDIEPTTDTTYLNSSYYTPPTIGESIHQKWIKNAQTAGEYVAAGDFSTALILLNQQIAAKNIEQLRELFVSYYVMNNASITWNYNVMTIPLSTKYRNQIIPHIFSQKQIIEDLIKELFVMFHKGKFIECRTLSQTIIHKVMLLTVNTHEEEQKLLEIIDIAKNYCLAVNLETTRKTESNQARAIELALYLTHLKLIPSHLRIVLQSAMRVTMRAGNYLSAKTVCSRLLNLAPPEKVAKQAQTALALIQQKGTNQYNVEYDERNPFEICALSMKPIYRGKNHLKCPLCGACFLPQHKGKICPICNVSEIGKKCSGIKIIHSLK